MQLAILKNDARYFQLVFQSLFLAYGTFFLHWNAEWWLYTIYFSVSIGTQFFCDIVFKKYTSNIYSKSWWSKFFQTIPSALISSFGLSLLLKTNYWQVAVFAAMVSILSKYIIRIDGKHIFNPSALGIVCAITTDNAWISTGQWGSNVVLLFGVICLGFIVATKVQQIDISLSFLGTLVFLLFLRQVIFLGWPLDFFAQSISTGSLLLFSFFMITDPRTTPNHFIARIIWGVIIAIASFYLSTFYFINGAPIFVLVFAQLLVPLMNRIFKANVFEWNKQPVKYRSLIIEQV